MDTPTAAARVLVVDDERALAQVVASYLVKDGFEVALAYDGPAAIETARRTEPEVVVLDLGLPGLDGVEVCRTLRTFSDCYVIMLTARTDEVDKLIGLSVGADDYMTKPFSPRELVARVRVMLRRPRSGQAYGPAGSGGAAGRGSEHGHRGPGGSGGGGGYDRPDEPAGTRAAGTGAAGTGAAEVAAAHPLTKAARDGGPTGTGARGETEEEPPREFGLLVIDTAGREVTVDGRPVELTRTEFDVLAALSARPKLAFSRRRLINAVWGDDWVGDEHLVDVHIGHLRRKLGDDAARPRFIRTIRGVGYRMGDGR